MTQQQLLDEFVALPDEAQRQVVDFVAFLQQKYNAIQSTQPRSTDLENEPFVGMWRDQKDLEESTTWVRSTRESQWGEGS